jgi:methionyl-tRNA synthetase
VLYILADSLRLLALMTSPIAPNAAQALWEKLGLDGKVTDRTYDTDNKWLLLPAGNKVEAGAPLFPRVEEEKSV